MQAYIYKSSEELTQMKIAQEYWMMTRIKEMRGISIRSFEFF